MKTANETEHLVALQNQLSGLRRITQTKLVQMWIEQKQREISAETERLGISEVSSEVAAMTDNELLAELE